MDKISPEQIKEIAESVAEAIAVAIDGATEQVDWQKRINKLKERETVIEKEINDLAWHSNEKYKKRAGQIEISKGQAQAHLEISKDLAKSAEASARKELVLGQNIIDMRKQFRGNPEATKALEKQLGLQKDITVQERDRASAASAEAAKYHKQALAQQEALEGQTALWTVLQNESGVFGGQVSRIFTTTKDVMKALKTNPWALILLALKLSVARFLELDSAAGGFRDKTGMLVPQMKGLAQTSRELNVQYAGFGVTIEKAYDAAAALTNVFKTLFIVTKRNQETVALLAANIGVSEESSAKFLQMFSGISQKVGYTEDDMALIVISLSKAGRVAPRQAFEDLAQASEETYIFLSKNPIELIRTAVAARVAGTSIDSMAKSARGFLNFQDSITAEMEASALVGKSVNFQLARQLAFQGDIEGSRKAALRQLRQFKDFDELSAYQKETLAKAAQLTVKEIIEQQAQERKLLALKTSQNPKDIAAYKIYTDMNKALKEKKKFTEEELRAQAHLEIKTRNRQTQLDNIMNSLREAGTALADSLLPMAEILVPQIAILARGLAFIFQIIGKGMTVWSPLWQVFKIFKKISSESVAIAKFMTMIGDKISYVGKIIRKGIFIFSKIPFIGRLVEGVAFLGDKIIWLISKLKAVGKFFGFLSRFALFAKAIPVIGWIITGIQFIFSLWKRFSDLFKTSAWADGTIGERFLLGLEAVGGAIWDVLIQPFIDIWNYLKETFMGSSPSKLGLLIVEGIKSVGGMLLNVLLFPFKSAWSVVKYLFSPSLLKSIFKGVGAIGSIIVGGIVSFKDKIINSVTSPLKTARGIADKLFTGAKGIGSSIASGLSSAGKTIFDIMTWPYKKAWSWLKETFMGTPMSPLGSAIIKGLAASVKTIYNFLISPFKSAWEYIQKIPFVRGLFNPSSIASTIQNQISSRIETAASIVVDVKNLDQLKEVVKQLSDAILKLSESPTAVAITETKKSEENAITKKLDELIGLMKAGAIAVNLDGRLVSKGLAVKTR